MDSSDRNTDYTKSSRVRKSNRTKKSKKLYDPSNYKEVHNQRKLSTTTTTTERAAPSSTATPRVRPASPPIAICEHGVSFYADTVNGSLVIRASRNQHEESNRTCTIRLALPRIGTTPASRGGRVSIVGTNHRGLDPADFDFNSIETWTVQDVGNFFRRYFPPVAEPFMVHEIDGFALLLLRRQDIITRFNLKMGPALNLYQVVRRLQSGDENLINELLETFYTNIDDAI